MEEEFGNGVSMCKLSYNGFLVLQVLDVGATAVNIKDTSGVIVEQIRIIILNLDQT